jgi:hypothetical protein
MPGGEDTCAGRVLADALPTSDGGFRATPMVWFVSGDDSDGCAFSGTTLPLMVTAAELTIEKPVGADRARHPELEAPIDNQPAAIKDKPRPQCRHEIELGCAATTVAAGAPYPRA